MGKRLNYWQLVRVESSGRIRCDDLEEANAFFRQHFLDYDHLINAPDRDIQRQLVDWFRKDSERAKQAELCLRCYASQALHISCLSLVKRFGKRYGFTLEELSPLVLGDLRPNLRNTRQQENAEFVSVSNQVIESFNPEKSGLSTWCDRTLKSNREVKKFLLEHGLELKTDWLILNRASVGQLERVLKAFGQTDSAIAEATDLLQAFQQVYRAEMLSSRGKIGRAYPAPNSQHLEKMSTQMVLLKGLAPEEVRDRLGQLTALFRKYSSHKPNPPLNADIPEPPPKNESKGLLDQYCMPCLEKAFQVVLRQRIDTFNQRDPSGEKAQKFLEALYLFHCEGESLGKIAPKINLNDQPKVSKLLNLKTFRDDVKLETIKHLKASVLELASAFRAPETLKQLENQVNAYLEGYLTDLMESAEREAYTSKRTPCQTDSLFSQTLCKILRNWR